MMGDRSENALVWVPVEVTPETAAFVANCGSPDGASADVYRLALNIGLTVLRAEAAETEFTALKTRGISETNYYQRVIGARELKKPSRAMIEGDRRVSMAIPPLAKAEKV